MKITLLYLSFYYPTVKITQRLFSVMTQISLRWGEGTRTLSWTSKDITTATGSGDSTKCFYFAIVKRSTTAVFIPRVSKCYGLSRKHVFIWKLGTKHYHFVPEERWCWLPQWAWVRLLKSQLCPHPSLEHLNFSMLKCVLCL